jgi:hypothetical protein
VAERKHELEPALRVARLIEIEDVHLTMSIFQVPQDVENLEDFHTEYFASVQRCEDGHLDVETGYRLARHEGADDADVDDVGDIEADEEQDDGAEVLGVAHFVVSYTYADAEPDSEDLDAFAYHNAVLNTWPYWRHHVQTMAAAMGLKRLLVPVHRIPIMPNKREGDSD